MAADLLATDGFSFPTPPTTGSSRAQSTSYSMIRTNRVWRVPRLQFSRPQERSKTTQNTFQAACRERPQRSVTSTGTHYVSRGRKAADPLHGQPYYGFMGGSYTDLTIRPQAIALVTSSSKIKITFDNARAQTRVGRAKLGHNASGRHRTALSLSHCHFGSDQWNQPDGNSPTRNSRGLTQPAGLLSAHGTELFSRTAWTDGAYAEGS